MFLATVFAGGLIVAPHATRIQPEAARLAPQVDPVTFGAHQVPAITLHAMRTVRDEGLTDAWGVGSPPRTFASPVSIDLLENPLQAQSRDGLHSQVADLPGLGSMVLADSEDDMLAELDAMKKRLDDAKTKLFKSDAKEADRAEGMRELRKDLDRFKSKIRDAEAKARSQSRQTMTIEDIQKDFEKDFEKSFDGFPDRMFGKSMFDFDSSFTRMAEVEDFMNEQIASVQKDLEQRQAEFAKATAEYSDLIDEAVKEADAAGKKTAQVVKETPDKRIEVNVEKKAPGQKRVEVMITTKDQSDTAAKDQYTKAVQIVEKSDDRTDKEQGSRSKGDTANDEGAPSKRSLGDRLAGIAGFGRK